MAEVHYNSANPFLGLPAPLVSKSVQTVDVNGRWAQANTFTLRGQITGQCEGFQYYIDKKNQIVSGFREDFKTLEFYESGSPFTGYSNVKLNSISFDAHNYGAGILGYEVSLSCYPEHYFSGTYGVLEPSETFSFQDGEDGTLTVSHNISAKGFCTTGGTSNALDNAKNWVQARTGWSSQVLPAYASGVTGGLCLQSLRENYDRLNGTYSVSESYIGDRYFGVSNGFLRYSTSVNSGEDGQCSVSLDGSIRNCKYGTISGLREKYSAFDAFSAAAQQYRDVTTLTDLNPIPVSRSVSEARNGVSLSFSYLWNNDTRGPIVVEYQTNFDYSFEEDLVSADVSATVYSKNPYSSGKWQQVLDFGEGINLYSIAAAEYANFVAQAAPHMAATPLSSQKLSESRSEDEYNCRLQLRESYNNAPQPPLGFVSQVSSIRVSPALNKYSASPILDGAGQYYLFDLGYKTRASIDVQVAGIGNDSSSPSSTLDGLKYRVETLRADYFQGTEMLLESQSVSTGNNSFGKQSSVAAKFSAEQSAFVV